jgi:putative ABC transport system permease protein
VESAGAITWLPFTGVGAATGFTVEGRPEPRAGEFPICDVRVVQPGYFKTMAIPLVQGRVFDAADNDTKAPLRFVVNQAMVRQLFPNQPALGQQLRVAMGRGDPQPGEIIGVVGDTKLSSLAGDVRPLVYYAHAKLPIDFMTLVVRAQRDPRPLAGAITAAVHRLDPEQPVSDVLTMDERIAKSLASSRFLTVLVSSFAGLAALLAMLGIYGVMSCTVAERTREMGLRMALGARPAEVRRMVLAQGARLLGWGLLLGLAGALAFTRVLEGLLFEIRPGDPWTHAGVLVLLSSVALAGCWLPARRATRIDPVVALRSE